MLKAIRAIQRIPKFAEATEVSGPKQKSAQKKSTIKKVLDAIENHGPISRKDLINRSSISSYSVAPILIDLVNNGEVTKKVIGKRGNYDMAIYEVVK